MHSSLLAVVLIILLGVVSIDCYRNCTDNGETFFYFAYGSNLLSKRMHINAPSAVLYNTARLDGYRLDFNLYVSSWRGAVATIVETPGVVVWGDVWVINKDQMDNLDKQEGTDRGWYHAKNVTVTTPEGEQIVARTYQETTNPFTVELNEDLPFERRPSSTYLAVITLGAIESHLPSDYIGFLFSFPTNYNMASNKIRQQLGYPL